MSTCTSTSAITPPMYVWIKLATAVMDRFAKVFLQPNSHIDDVGALSCSTLEWGRLRANQVEIYLVANAGDKKPNQVEIEEALKLLKPLEEDATLESASVKSGSWLVAKPIQVSSMTSVVSTGECHLLLFRLY
jgi:hypothetical protein